MAKTPAKDSFIRPESPDAETVTKSPNPPKEQKEPQPDRLALLLDPESGNVLWDRMRPSTKEQVRKAMTDPRAAKELGLVATGSAPAATSEDSAAMNAQLVMLLGVAFDLVGRMSVVAAKSRGYHPSAAEVLRWTEEEKQGAGSALVPLLNKYDIAGGKWKEEIAAGMVVGGVLLGKVMMLNAMQANLSASVTTATVPPVAPAAS